MASDPRQRAKDMQSTIKQLVGVSKAQAAALASGDEQKHEKLCTQETGLFARLEKLLMDPDLPAQERIQWQNELDVQLAPWML